MQDSGIKLKYSARLLRVRVEVAMARFALSPEPPPETVERCRRKMAQLHAAGIVERFAIHEERFREAWAAVHARPPQPGRDPPLLGITVASGHPKLEGLALVPPKAPDGPLQLTLDAASERITWWVPEWLQLWAAAEAGTLGLALAPEHCDVHALLVKAAHGQRPATVLLRALAPPARTPAGAAVEIVSDAARGQVDVVVHRADGVGAADFQEEILEQVRRAVRALRKQGEGSTVVLTSALRLRLGLLARSQQRLGVGLPVRCLAAVVLTQAERPAGGSRSKPWFTAKTTSLVASAAADERLGTGRSDGVAPALAVAVAPAGVAATLGPIDGAALARSGFAPTESWLLAELARHGVVAGLAAGKLKEVLAALVAGADVGVTQVATATPSVAPEGPYLHLVYKDPAAGGASGAPAMREAQRRAFVRKGEVVAEVRFKTPGAPGEDVRGLPTAAAAPADGGPVLTIGAGIALEPGGRYVATADGAPRLDGEVLCLDPLYRHAGDVNLTSGNIHFDGAAEVLGSIESGAVVEVSGDLLVHGSIFAADVRCGGSLTVLGGIVAGAAGRIRVKGALTAGFIDGSRVVCAGDLVAHKGILASVVVSGGNVTVEGAPDALVAGGSVSCWGDLRATNVGREGGVVTTLHIGVDWRAALAAELRLARLARVTAKVEAARKGLDELLARPPAALAKKARERKAALGAWLAKADALLPRMKAHADRAKESVKTHPSARLLVTKLMSANLALHLAGQRIATPQALLGIAVSARRVNGSPFTALDGSGNEAAKAS